VRIKCTVLLLHWLKKVIMTENGGKNNVPKSFSYKFCLHVLHIIFNFYTSRLNYQTNPKYRICFSEQLSKNLKVAGGGRCHKVYVGCQHLAGIEQTAKTWKPSKSRYSSVVLPSVTAYFCTTWFHISAWLFQLWRVIWVFSLIISYLLLMEVFRSR
jgi:hypothetical protein